MRASLAKPPHLPAPVQSASRRSSAQRGAVLLLALAPALLAMPALAQTTRTYVSGKGSGANACTQAAPCLTLQVARRIGARGDADRGIARRHAALHALSKKRIKAPSARSAYGCYPGVTIIERWLAE
jgi:hypothetical protein